MCDTRQVPPPASQIQSCDAANTVQENTAFKPRLGIATAVGIPIFVASFSRCAPESPADELWCQRLAQQAGLHLRRLDDEVRESLGPRTERDYDRTACYRLQYWIQRITIAKTLPLLTSPMLCPYTTLKHSTVGCTGYCGNGSQYCM
eukprot:3938776-Rhodomonas_salina.7